MARGDDKKPVKKAAAKSVAPSAPAKKPAAQAKVNWKQAHSHLFEKRSRVFKVGRAVLPAKRDLSRYVKWPKYIRLQRQKAILLKRLKVPPAIHQFTTTIDKNQAGQLFHLLAKYRPESRIEKTERLKQQAAAQVGGGAAAGGAGKKGQAVGKAQKPKNVKFGINHIATLVENKKAKLVVIAHDVDPIELVVWLPALCRKFDTPYCIVKGKARLGAVVHKKTATALAITDINKEDVQILEQLKTSFANLYTDASRTKKWGGGIMGHKAEVKKKKLSELRAKEAAKKLKA
jgi:large subunit ribosomal protein L7Ae